MAFLCELCEYLLHAHNRINARTVHIRELHETIEHNKLTIQ